jgi:hypothetical protein
MYNNDTDVLFPIRVIPELRSLRGSIWENLVDRVWMQHWIHPEKIAFVLLMVRLSGCSTCQADSYRAMRGCTHCAIQTIRRFRGDDRDLEEQYYSSLRDIKDHLRTISYSFSLE